MRGSSLLERGVSGEGEWEDIGTKGFERGGIMETRCGVRGRK